MLLKARAAANEVAPRLIASGDDLERIAMGTGDKVAALHGWRGEIFGEDALRLCRGELGLVVRDGEVTVIGM